MVIKLLTIDLLLPGCSSLKEKRFVLTSLKARLRQRFNVAVSEVGFHDKWQRAMLAIVTVGSDRKIVDSGCEKALRLIEGEHRAQLLDYEQEIR